MRFSFLLVLFALAPCALADLPVIRLDRLEPMGGAAGSTVLVQTQAGEDDEAKSLLFDHAGIRAEFVERGKFKVTIAAEVPAGTYDARLVGRFGVSNPRQFAVSRGLAEIAEKEGNNTAADAQQVEINCVVNGTSDSNDVDAFRFRAKAGQRVTLDCQAVKLDSELNGVMTLATAAGKLLATSSDYHARDPFLDFIAAAEGEYVVAVYDLSYRGGQPYRLTISDGPQIENVFPRAIQAGGTAELLALGRNLGPAAAKSAWQIDDLALDSLAFSATPPADVSRLGQFLFADHPTDHAGLPTAATCTLTGFQVLPALAGTLRGQNVLVTPDAVVSEVEPNDAPQAAQPVAAPVTISARFDRPRDVDYYELQPAAAGEYVFEVYCERIAGRADPYLIVADEQNNIRLESDDFGHRVNAFDGHLRDPVGSCSLEAQKKYRITVGDRYSRGGARFQYVLCIRPPRPNFYAAAIHRQNPGPSGLSVWRGGAEYLDIVLHRFEGLGGPVTLEALDLPPGMHATKTTIRDGARGTFVLWSDRDAPVQSAPIRLRATAQHGEQTIEREVRPYTRVWPHANIGTSCPTRQLMLATCDEAPFVVRLEPAEVTVEAGKRAQFKAVATRYWPDLKDPIQLTPLSFQGNFNFAAAAIPAAQTELAVAIDVQQGTPPGLYTMALQCQLQVPFSKDPKAEQKPTLLHTMPSLPITLNVVPAK